MENFEFKNVFIEILGQRFKVDADGYVPFGDVSRQLMNKQAQYGSRYTDGLFQDYPNLGQDLRFKGNSDSYHEQRIHKDDIEIFINRYQEYREKE